MKFKEEDRQTLTDIEAVIMLAFLETESVEFSNDGRVQYYLHVTDDGDIIREDRSNADRMIVCEMEKPDMEIWEDCDPYEWETTRCPEFVQVVRDIAMEYKNQFGDHRPKLV